jgi:3-oxoacyl-[acyl-carrier-protein] synthase II
MSGAPIAITGAGVFCALGKDREQLRRAWQAGDSGIRPITLIEEPWFPAREGGEIPDLDKLDSVDKRQRKHLKVMTRPVKVGLAAARAAWAERVAAGRVPDAERRGAFVGAGLHVDEGGDFVEPLRRSYDEEETFTLERWADEGVPVLNPLWLIKGLSNNVLAFASLFLDLQGVNDNLCDGEVAGLLALGEAMAALREGRCDIALAGGYGTYLTLEDQVGLLRGGRLDDNFVPGEGGAFFVLERPADAARAGVPVLGQLLGFGSCQQPADPLPLARRDAGWATGEAPPLVADIQARLGNSHGGHGAMLAAVALCQPGQRQAVRWANPDGSAAAMVLEVPPG